MPISKLKVENNLQSFQIEATIRALKLKTTLTLNRNHLGLNPSNSGLKQTSLCLIQATLGLIQATLGLKQPHRLKTSYLLFKTKPTLAQNKQPWA